jgi:serine/threonine protein kinase
MTMQVSGNEAGMSVVEMRRIMQAQLGDAIRIVEVLGAHGAEYLLRAYDGGRGEDEFIRVLAPNPAAAPAVNRSFEHRAELAARLDHPNIAPVGPLQRGEGLAYYIVPDVGASTLASLLTEGEPFPFDRTIAILREVAAALDHAHARGVVHGQLEPASIGVREDGTIVVSKFGAGSGIPFSHSGRSPAYVAPEQWQQHATTEGRADIYALGVIAFEMITGRRRAISLSAERIAIVDPLPITHDAPLRPGVGLHVNQALLRAVSKRAAARFATAGEFVAMLEGRSPMYGLPTQHPTLDIKRSRFALVPIVLVTVLGVTLGVMAAPIARQATRGSTDVSLIDGIKSRLSELPVSGYAVSTSSGSSGSASGHSTNSSGTSSSQPIFPGAASASGSGISGPSKAAPTTPRTVAQSASGAAPSTPAAATRAGRADDEVPVSVPAASSNDSSGFVRVEFQGASALVFVDGVPRGSTPFIGKLRTGVHSVSIVSSSSIPTTNRQIVVHQGDTTIADFSFSPAAPR